LALLCGGGKERATASNGVDSLLHTEQPLLSSPSSSYPVCRLLRITGALIVETAVVVAF